MALKPDWKLEFLVLENSHPFLKFMETYEKEMIRACMIPNHLFGVKNESKKQVQQSKDTK